MKIVDPAVLCAKAALDHGVKKFVEVSSAQVYNPNKVGVHALYAYTSLVVIEHLTDFTSARYCLTL